MKKSLKVALAAVCLIAAGAFFMGCANPNGGETGSGSGSGSSSGAGTGSGTGTGGSSWNGPKYAIGDIVLNDGTKVAYSVAKDYTGDELTTFQGKAVAVIFKADTESAPALGVGIKHERKGLAWCKDSSIKGYNTNFTETVCASDSGTSAGSYTFNNSPNTDGSKNLAKMVKQLDGDNDTGVTCNADGTINFASSTQATLKENYPSFEFTYYYGKNVDHNTKGTSYETGWYLPSLSELNDIYQANKTDKIVDNALEKCSGINNKISKSWYWSSSQYASYSDYACGFSFGNGDWSYDSKGCFNGSYVCAVRAFN